MAEHIAGAAGPPEGAYDADVVILALDRPAETVAAIGSALGQSGVSRHVFVLDQGSRAEASAQVAAAVAGRGDATLVRLDHNRGVAGGRNFGSALGHGRVIFGLDNDAEFAARDTLAGAVAALDAVPDLAALGCRIVCYENGADDLLSWGYPRTLLPLAAAGFDTVTFVGAGHAIRRAAWQQVGGYDDALFFCWEEYDFCLRAIARGWRIAYRGDLVVRHKVSADRRLTWTGQRWYHFVRNRLYIGRKYGSPWIALLPRFGGYLVKGMRNGLCRDTLRAWPAAVRMAQGNCLGPLPAPALDYIKKRDALPRGGWLSRLRQEVLVSLPDTPTAFPPCGPKAGLTRQ